MTKSDYIRLQEAALINMYKQGELEVRRLTSRGEVTNRTYAKIIFHSKKV